RMVLSHSVALPRALQQINKREDHDPHEIDEVPVETENLDRVVIIRRIHTAQASEQDAEQVNNATSDVHAVEASNDKKSGAEKRCSREHFTRLCMPGPTREPHASMNQMCPLKGLHDQKDHTTQDSQADELTKPGLIVLLHGS